MQLGLWLRCNQSQMLKTIQKDLWLGRKTIPTSMFLSAFFLCLSFFMSPLQKQAVPCEVEEFRYILLDGVYHVGLLLVTKFRIAASLACLPLQSFRCDLCLYLNSWSFLLTKLTKDNFSAETIDENKLTEKISTEGVLPPGQVWDHIHFKV